MECFDDIIFPISPYDPYTGELNIYYEELTGDKNQLIDSYQTNI